MKKQVMETIRRYEMLRPGDTVLCALSGGADSTAMTLLLHALKDKLEIRVCAAHLNHLLRGEESEEDERFVRSFCDRLQIPLYAERADAAAYAKERHMGLEAGARTLRYDFFDRAAKALGADKIATAHTADDNLETVLFHLARGASTEGLCGIPPVRGRIIRPLLETERREIIRYLTREHQPYRIDSTNGDISFARNRIRMVAVPVLRAVNPAAAATAAENLALLREDCRFLNEAADALFNAHVRKTKERASIGTEELGNMPRAMSGRVIERMYDWVRPGESLSAAHVESVRKLAKDPHPSKGISVPGGVRAAKRGNRLAFFYEEQPPEISEHLLKIDGETDLPEVSLQVICRKIFSDEEIHSSFNTFYVNCDTIKGTAVVRSRKTGDRLTLGRRGVTKTVKKWMIENRIPIWQRAAMPVIADENGVIAVSGCGVDRRCEASAGDKNSICITIRSV